MADSQQNLVRLQELNFIAGETQSDAVNALWAQERQNITQEFAHTYKEINSFLEKTFPQAIDMICSLSLNKSITRKGKVLFFKNQEVQSQALTYDNCLSVCKEVLSAFPHTVNTMVSALKSRAGSSYIEEISQKLCREFNTISVFQAEAERLQNECIVNAQSMQKHENSKQTDYSDNYSESLTIPIGKSGTNEISIEFNINVAGANSVVVSGITRSGKSAFLQSLILGAAYKYSPDQLQFWILDFKDGTGFVHLEGLKHIRFMCLKNRPVDAIEITNHIDREYKRRADLIRESGGGDMKDYNRRAKEKGEPLLPRLMIVIDEFVYMYRACFPVLSKIARLGVSTGIGFIFSSQIIETGAVYGDAILQANHLFEFQNADGVFGRLIRNITQEEKSFVGSGVKGNCIYRYGEQSRTMFRTAYAGGVEEQKRFLKSINEKWKDYHYDKPLIAGSPERKLNNPDEIVVNSQAIRDKFKQTKTVFVPLGESRMGESYLYKIDRQNPLLIAFGDETRIASAELSVIEHFKVLSQSEKALYYVDLNCNPDRELNAITAKYSENSSDICYVDTDNGARSVIDIVYRIMKKRRYISITDRTKDIGNPIELIIHNAERILELKDEIRSLKMGTIVRKQQSITADMDLDDILSVQPNVENNTIDGEDDIGTLKKLREIIENGKNSRIFLMLYFEESSRFQNMINDLFGYSFDFKDVLVVPRIPNEYEELSYSEVVDSLSACRLREQASSLDQTNEQAQNAVLERNDFICAVMVDDKVPHKIIPYEWTTEEN